MTDLDSPFNFLSEKYLSSFSSNFSNIRVTPPLRMGTTWASLSPSKLEVESERLTRMRKWGRRSSRFCSIRKSGRGSFVEVLMPCFLIKQRSSSTVVGSKEESWYWVEVDEGV